MRYKQPGLPIQMQIQKDPCLKMTKRSQTERIFSLFDNRQMAFDIFTSRICVLKNFALQIIYSESVVCKSPNLWLITHIIQMAVFHGYITWFFRISTDISPEEILKKFLSVNAENTCISTFHILQQIYKYLEKGVFGFCTKKRSIWINRPKTNWKIIFGICFEVATLDKYMYNKYKSRKSEVWFGVWRPHSLRRRTMTNPITPSNIKNVSKLGFKNSK